MIRMGKSIRHKWVKANICSDMEISERQQTTGAFACERLVPISEYKCAIIIMHLFTILWCALGWSFCALGFVRSDYIYHSVRRDCYSESTCCLGISFSNIKRMFVLKVPPS